MECYNNLFWSNHGNLGIGNIRTGNAQRQQLGKPGLERATSVHRLKMLNGITRLYKHSRDAFLGKEAHMRLIHDTLLLILKVFLEQYLGKHTKITQVGDGGNHDTLSCKLRAHLFKQGIRIYQMFKYIIEIDCVEVSIGNVLLQLVNITTKSFR